MSPHLHIICFDVPYPADYGGVTDVFYKLPSLQKLGVQIHLHCFEYKDRHRQPELEKYCCSVHYYKRRKKVSFRLPYIVSSRKNKQLLFNLLQDDYPILMEGVHCTYPLTDKRFTNRKMFVRLHNTEFIYYRHLFKYTSHWFKQMYYLGESILLQWYERRIAKLAATFLAMSHTDAAIYHNVFGSRAVYYLPLFIPPWKVSGNEGLGTYCLYQGRLDVEENEKAVFWLIENVFSNNAVPFVIGGKNPSARLVKKIKQHQNITLAANTSEDEMNNLIMNAHIHVLPSFNATGIKIKLVNALYNGRHCVVNTAAIQGTSMAALCHVADGAADTQAVIQSLLQKPFTKEDMEARERLLYNEFDNALGAKYITQLL